MPTLPIDELESLAARALEMAGASPAAARAAARALVAADVQGLSSHGVSRVPQYPTFLRNGRTNPKAVPAIVRSKGGACLVDAQCGMAYERARWRPRRASQAPTNTVLPVSAS